MHTYGRDGGPFQDRRRARRRSTCRHDGGGRQHGTAPLRIGTRDFKSYFLGAIREVRIWSRALTATEVGALYTGSVPQDGLVAEYLLDQAIALDSLGRHNGVIVGANWIAS